MTDNDLRDSIKEQVNRVIDSIYAQISNAGDLKPTSKYSFNISITNPLNDEVLNRKFSFQGDEIIIVRDLINKNKTKANAIKRVLKKEAWKIVFSIIKEGI